MVVHPRHLQSEPAFVPKQAGALPTHLPPPCHLPPLHAGLVLLAPLRAWGFDEILSLAEPDEIPTEVPKEVPEGLDTSWIDEGPSDALPLPSGGVVAASVAQPNVRVLALRLRLPATCQPLQAFQTNATTKVGVPACLPACEPATSMLPAAASNQQHHVCTAPATAITDGCRPVPWLCPHYHHRTTPHHQCCSCPHPGLPGCNLHHPAGVARGANRDGSPHEGMLCWSPGNRPSSKPSGNTGHTLHPL